MPGGGVAVIGGKLLFGRAAAPGGDFGLALPKFE